MTNETPHGLGPRPAVIGDNNPPEETPPAPPMTLQERLEQDHKDLAARVAELLQLCEAAPAEVKTEEQFKPLSDLLKAGRVALASSESARKIENEESRRITAQIDAWFKNPAEKLKAALAAVKDRTDVYLEEKRVAEEKRRREEADRKALAAEEKRWDAIWTDARAELAAYDARKAEEKALADRLRKEAAARREAHLKDRAKRLSRVTPYLERRAARRRKADELRAQLAKEEEDRKRLAAEALQREATERQRIADENAKAAADAEAARKETQAARSSERRATTAAAEHGERAEELAGQAGELEDAAGRMQKRADKADRHANASPADMSRTRSEMGTTSSSSRRWEVISVDKSVIDLNLLRGFLHPDAVDVAVRGYMMAHRNDPGGPKLDGAVFDQVEEGVYR